MVGDRRVGTISGYFDSPEALADSISRIEHAKGIYIVPNVVNPALLARANNRIRITGKGDPLTADHDIVQRRWLLIDLDPQRPAGISSTDTEHSLAHERAEAIRSHLRELGWPEPILADSGNGWHLLFRIDLAADDGGLVQRCLTALAARFDDAAVKVDTGVFNPARIWKLYGTLACKGDATADRRHRMSRLVCVPDKIDVVPVTQLTELAGQPIPNAAGGMIILGDLPAITASSSFDIDAWIKQHIPDAGEPQPWSGGPKMWKLAACPFSTAHTDGAFVAVLSSGAISAGCHHNGCQGKDWHDLRQKLDPRGARQTTAFQTKGGTTERADAKAEWGQPRPFETGSTPPPFPLEDAFPASLSDLRAFVVAVAEQLQVPMDLPAMMVLPFSSVCIAKKFEIELRPGWREPPALWVLELLFSGERKSGTFSVMAEPILGWERDEAERLRPDIARAVEERKIVEARLAACRKAAAKATLNEVKEKTEQAVALAQELDAMPIPKVPVVFTSDATTEGLAGMLVENQERALVASPEADALDVMMGRYAEKNVPNMGIWLKGHAGDPERIIRRSRPPEYLKRPVLSVAMVVQPEAVRGMFASRVARGRGLLARFLPSSPASMLGFRKTGGAAEPIPPGLTPMYRKTLRRLLDMPIDLEAGPTIVRLSAEATALFNAFEAHVESQLAKGGAFSDRRDWGGKLCGAIARIALVLHCLQFAVEGGSEGSARNALELDAQTMRAALAWAPYLIDHEKIVAGVVGCDHDTVVAERLIEWLQRTNEPSFTRRQAFTENRFVLVQTVEDIDGALVLLEDFGYIRRVVETEPRPAGGRPPSPTFVVNPIWVRIPPREAP
ncbi:MAG: DUF3987 domain-containing protein [Phycisphaerales bacterium]|nr:DUF3987 domain-containing protein [Phycisphaerales bacterium]